MKNNAIIQLIIQQGLLPLYFHEDEELSVSIMRALYRGGIRAIEYTNRGEKALDNFEAMRKVASEELPDLLLGAGTIKNRDAAKHFIKAGADFLISPGLADAVGELCEKEDVLWVPGCMTPTELIAAEKWSVKLVKLFPGNLLGPAFVHAIKELFPKMMFIPTGGVDLDENNLRAWFQSGVSAIGMGSKLITKQMLEERNYDRLTQLTQDTISLIRKIKAA